MVSIQQLVALTFIRKFSLALCLNFRLIIMLENGLLINIRATRGKIING